MKSTLFLFKGLPVGKNKGLNKTEIATIFNKTIKKGFVFDPVILNSYSFNDLENLVPIVERYVGIDAIMANNSFHKSWNKVETADIHTLMIEQLVHYFTTYGFESPGTYDKDFVYVPKEKLNIPKLQENVPLVCIHGYKNEQLKEKLLSILNAGIALKDKTKDAVIDLFVYLDLKETDLCSVKNKEVKIALYDYFGWVPSIPVEFVRYIIYKATSKTLLIKDKETIRSISTAVNKNINIVPLFQKYEKEHGLARLSEVYYRFKPIFLAFKTNTKLCSYINKLNKLAKTNHVPMSEDFINSVTNRAKKNILDFTQLSKELDKVNIFRKVKLAQALKIRTVDIENIAYNIRNGKVFAEKYEGVFSEQYDEALSVVLKSISEDITKSVNGKKIFIPEYITYTMPNSEKQFFGNFPIGTSISVPEQIIFGVHWFDTSHKKYNYYRDDDRVDLDLSLIDNSGDKVGWNAIWRTQSKNILFSGDMTAAPKPNGASELFHINATEEASDFHGIVAVNYYNYGYKDPQEATDFKLFVGKDDAKKVKKNYMIDPNKILTSETSDVARQKIIGLVVASKGFCKFYYCEGNIGGKSVFNINENTKKARDFLFDFYQNNVTLNEVLSKIPEVELVSSKENCDIDLSPESLEKDTFIKLMVPQIDK